ncbi:response regulator transcription factor [Demequina sp. TTPB684]|uniref:response regulator transcription factor n=1 Tax=unclassified Demequina TaxID=2620311 RepID=UPI001CF5FA58|nr:MULTISPECIES: response regulator transcription factor [unclassified Demequina]MCB2413327.1 response regulator transcription factor [Demequina sp. TTPB684]UPU87466.1 response regulator transcription factor [Demequina sp. TMPB413]
MTDHVLIVEDEETYRDSLRFIFEREGFRVTLAANGREGIEAFERDGADVVLLDLMLPEVSGTDVFRAIRTHSDVPVVMVTARDDQVDKIIGLELGADDYVTKPFSGRELVARVRNVLRRASALPADLDDEPTRLTVSRFTLDPERLTVTKDGVAQSLPPKEFALFYLLAANAGRVLTRQVIIDRVWGADYFGDTKTLDVHIKRLRGRIEDEPGSPQHLQTVRGVGYTFEP